ncbi:MAG TPA: helix-turn-helix domain-containing protein [Sphingomonas sp.]|nr:helix-turn-helix domain-containing protein [Sphingomonas sp.]
MATADRVLAVLGLFTMERPEWTVDAIAAELGLSGSTAYQYVGSLAKAGLLVTSRAGRYTVGPAAIELDRIARRVDPLARRARSILCDLVEKSDVKAIGLLCRLYRFHVMCVDQYVLDPPGLEVSYERGRPMPLTRGSASRVILANLPARPLRRFFERAGHAEPGIAPGTGWEDFKREVKRIKQAGVLVAVGELDPGALGISAPVFGEDGIILGSISLVLAAPAVEDPAGIWRLKDLVRAAGVAVTKALQSD